MTIVRVIISQTHIFVSFDTTNATIHFAEQHACDDIEFIQYSPVLDKARSHAFSLACTGAKMCCQISDRKATEQRILNGDYLNRF